MEILAYDAIASGVMQIMQLAFQFSTRTGFHSYVRAFRSAYTKDTR